MLGEGVASGVDFDRLQEELDNYQEWLDVRTEECYQIAERAREVGLDHKTNVEIPRTSDLAGRTEKLLVEHLEGVEIADEIRVMLAEHDRETTAIKMAQSVSRNFKENGFDLVKSIDVGLRVGLAILTEAVLVAPLEGISEVRLLHNMDGTPFVSIHFAGPIRAAGGTAQALAVLIADMIRRELGVGRYVPTHPEVERVKEEFGLYRGNLQYRPPPEEVETIVRACPVMVNGESTESIECSGYGECRNIDEARVRGGVLLVIGEGLCLKAPKIQKHTERLKVPGWEFISEFAEKGNEGESEGDEKMRRVKPITKFMQDIIAGRPVFGDPSEAGGFRLRYGRARPSGLAAASLNPASMVAMDDFLTVGTQMKIERPGKACAITPCSEAEGPSVLLKDGAFLRVDDVERWAELQERVISIWDNGELVLGYGEFLENNKELVPAGYGADWWASDLLRQLDSKAVKEFCELTGIDKSSLPTGSPEEGDEKCRREWHRYLRSLQLGWKQDVAIANRFGTSLHGPNNLTWADLPLEWIEPLITVLEKSVSGKGCLRIRGGVSGWSPKPLQSLQSSTDSLIMPGPKVSLPEPLFSGEIPESMHLLIHGLAKATALMLGMQHHHDGDDLVITSGWEALLHGLGFSIEDGAAKRIADAAVHLRARCESLRSCAEVIRVEKKRLSELEGERRAVRIAAETKARQEGHDIAETDRLGRNAMQAVPDEGPADSKAYRAALTLEDEHLADGVIWLIRQVTSLRWEHSAPIRIGARMGRPEKAAPREMKPAVHALFPIGMEGGPQRALSVAMQKGSLRIQMGMRACTTCGKASPMLSCHHPEEGVGAGEKGVICAGRTEPRQNADDVNKRRKGVFQTIPLQKMAEQARRNLGLDRLPKRIKCVKGLMSRSQTPEPLEKGVLRAKHSLPVFRDGTIRFDMSDVPTTHFKPEEIGVDHLKLVDLGYTHDIDGEALTSSEQIVELYPQDFIASQSAADYLLRITHFIDELLERHYGMPAFYHCQTQADLVGHLMIALAPHTSGGVLSRIIGFSDSSGGYAHPLFHAAKRRNCDGDEDAVMMLMDGLLNFSRDILPANRGGQMDAPLVLTTRLNPTEVDKEALNVDSAWYYPSGFYEATLKQPHPKEVSHLMDYVERRLGTPASLRGYGYTHGCDTIDEGPALSAYKTLETMVDKMNGQLELGRKLRSVDVRNVASSVVRSHFLPDLRGNLVAFTRQKIRCLKCGHSYRRMPLASKCINVPKGEKGRPRAGLAAHGIEEDESRQCGGNLALTVTEGAVRKYIDVTGHVMETYGVDNYTRQNVEWLAKSTDSLFNNDRVRQASLFDFI